MHCLLGVSTFWALSVHLSIASVSDQPLVGGLLSPGTHSLLLHFCHSCGLKLRPGSRRLRPCLLPSLYPTGFFGRFPPFTVSRKSSGLSSLLPRQHPAMGMRPSRSPKGGLASGPPPFGATLSGHCTTGCEICTMGFKNLDYGTLAFRTRFSPR